MSKFDEYFIRAMVGVIVLVVIGEFAMIWHFVSKFW
jgi:hypothetical protein